MSTTGVKKADTSPWPDAHAQRPLPAVTGDFYGITTTVSEDDKAILARVRAFMEAEVAPIINDYWIRAAFPFELIPRMAALDIAGISYNGYGCAGKTTVLDGLLAVEMARIDPSIATFFGVHSGLAMGSIYLCGSEEQKQQWLPVMRRMEKIGAFGLTEPERRLRSIGRPDDHGAARGRRVGAQRRRRSGSATPPSPMSPSSGRATRPTIR